MQSVLFILSCQHNGPGRNENTAVYADGSYIMMAVSDPSIHDSNRLASPPETGELQLMCSYGAQTYFEAIFT